MNIFDRYSRRTWIWTKTMFFRITITKVTICFFLFSFLHCFVHGIVQSLLFSFDQSANSLVSTILSEAQVPQNEVAWLQRDGNNFTLKLCQHVPVAKENADQCVLVFQSGMPFPGLQSGFKKRASLRQRSITAHTVTGDDGNIEVDFSSSDVLNGSEVRLDEQCTRVLIYADQVLRNSKREELALIGSEFWLLGISVFAIMYDSIPHLVAGFFMRVLSTGWSSYEIWRTHDINRRFDALITNGACQVDLFPHYFNNRIHVQRADLVLNVVALVLSGYLVGKLVQRYATCMFSRVGAPKHLIRLYRFFLGVFICLQMSVYLLVTSMSLWIDQLINGPLVNISTHNIAYLVSFTVANVLLIPWIALGWFSVRRELRRSMVAFLLVGVIYIGGWSVLYYSQVFRWTWIQWPFFACLAVAAVTVQLASIGLGIVCRLNFNRGLAQYFHADTLLTRSDFEPEVFPHDLAATGNYSDPEKNAELQVDFKVINITALSDDADRKYDDDDGDAGIDSWRAKSRSASDSASVMERQRRSSMEKSEVL